MLFRRLSFPVFLALLTLITGLARAKDDEPIEIKAVAGLRYDPPRFVVKPGAKVKLQVENTDDMAHKIARCIEWVSATHTLLPGDILATGTNHRGLHAFQNGDKIDLEVEQVGKLSIHVTDALGRTWGRDTRLEREGMKPETSPQLTGKYAPAA